VLLLYHTVPVAVAVAVDSVHSRGGSNFRIGFRRVPPGQQRD